MDANNICRARGGEKSHARRPTQDGQSESADQERTVTTVEMLQGAKALHVKRSKFRELPPVELLLELYDFNWETCEFTFAKGKGWGRIAGKPAANGLPSRGFKGSQYLGLSMGGQSYAVHRLVWKMFTGRDPVGVVDHINGDRHDNRIANLRDVSPAENARNNHGKGYWANVRTFRAAAVEKAIRQAAAEKRQKFEAKERAELARLASKYGCPCLTA